MDAGSDLSGPEVSLYGMSARDMMRMSSDGNGEYRQMRRVTRNMMEESRGFEGEVSVS